MKFTASILIAAALASSASADVIFSTSVTTLPVFTNRADVSRPSPSCTYGDTDPQAQATRVANQVNSALSTYITSKTAQPEYSSYTKALSEYLATRSGAPASVILNPDTTTILTTEPAWYTAMPTEIKNYAQNLWDEQERIKESIIKENAAARPTGAAGMVGVGMAAVAAGAAIFL